MKLKLFNRVMLILVILFAITSHAQIPRTLSYQGVLTDNAGTPWPDGSYTFKFCLYSSNSGGTPLWCEEKTLPVKKELFSTVLGDKTPFGPTVKFDQPYWLGIHVDNESELTPRIPLTSVGYSMNSLRADTAMVAVNTSNVVFHPLTIDLTGNSGPDGRAALFVEVSADNDHGVLVVNKPRFVLWSGSEGRQAKLGTSTLTIDLTGNSGPEGRDALFVEASPDNDSGVLVVNKPRFTLWSASEDKPAGLGTNTLTIDLGSNSGPEGRDALFLKSSPDNNVSTIVTNTNKILLWSEQKQNPADLDCGRASASILEIRGGSDIAEPFEISHDVPLHAGALVVIDPDDPGKLKQATEPYDKRVAGVISGAGGINPGLTLKQEGVLDAGQHVALSGKVYALATAANGPIEPGDLLTTSEVPGHAMKATDEKRSFGSVIGKAMSGLQQGEGLVLVLIQPH